MHEFAVVFVFDVDDAPFVGAGANHFAVDSHGFFRADDGERDAVLVTLERVQRDLCYG